jgi:hypothetical protein
MPKTLNPQNTFPTSITNFPISGNNEPMTIEPLENAIQAVLNRTENLHVRLSEAETQGVKRVRTVASLAALSAATGFNNGDVCDVEGYGRYRLYNPSGLTADGLWVLTAAGGGRWVHTLRDMRGIGNGLATLDSSQRLAQDVRDASILTQHIANQAVTAAKLAPGSVVGHLGYTPLNKAGDTWTGDLIGGNLYAGRYLGMIGDIDEAKWFLYTGDYSTYLFSDHNDTSALPGVSNQTIFGRTYRAKAAFRPEGHLDIAGEYRGRYDHENRFVMQSYLSNNISIYANAIVAIGRTRVSVPSGKELYLRRVRWEFSNSWLRPRIISLYTWTGSSTFDDVAINQQLGDSGVIPVGLYIVNTSSSLQSEGDGYGIWAELEIR